LVSIGDRVPGLRAVRSYDRRWLAKDVAAGLVLTALLVPAGMGYAEASGLPPIAGLYATIIPLLVYAVLGPSRVLVQGPDSSLAPLIAATVVPLAAGDPDRLVALAGALAVLVGLIGLAAGAVRIGFLTDLVSTPVRVGYLNGVAVVILASQLPRLFGIDVEATGVLGRFAELARGIADGETDAVSLALGGGAIAVMLVLRRWAPRVPGALVAVVGGIVAVRVLGLADDGLALVGSLPQGLPSFTVPDVRWSDLDDLVAGALGIAVVALTDTSVLSRSFAARRGEQVDPDKELLALGAVNVGAGLFQGFPVCASSSRTPAAEEVGARTQLTGVVGALAIAALLVAAPGLFADLPSAVLAAIVIGAAAGLVDVGEVARLLRVRRGEFVLSVACFLGVVVLGVLPGIGLAVALAVADVVRRAWRPHTAELVRVDGLKGYHDVARHPEGHRVPGLVLYRFDAPLFFANAEWFRSEVLALVEQPADGPVRWVVVTAEPITDVDTTAADALEDLHEDLARRGVVLAFAELKGHVRERLERYGMVDRLGADRFYRTVGEAVKAYVRATGTTWVDWEDRGELRP
jgi:high affinity sulfate transporter 1